MDAISISSSAHDDAPPYESSAQKDPKENRVYKDLKEILDQRVHRENKVNLPTNHGLIQVIPEQRLIM